MDRASTSTECMTMLSNDSGFHILEVHLVSLQNPRFFIWADFVILVLTCIMTYFVIMYFGLVYIYVMCCIISNYILGKGYECECDFARKIEE